MELTTIYEVVGIFAKQSKVVSIIVQINSLTYTLRINNKMKKR